jgi:hypothetical protein
MTTQNLNAQIHAPVVMPDGEVRLDKAGQPMAQALWRHAASAKLCARFAGVMMLAKFAKGQIVIDPSCEAFGAYAKGEFVPVKNVEFAPKAAQKAHEAAKPPAKTAAEKLAERVAKQLAEQAAIRAQAAANPVAEAAMLMLERMKAKPAAKRRGRPARK